MGKNSEKRAAKDSSKRNVRDFDPAGFLGELECFDEVHEMVVAGSLVRDVATFIHGRNEATHVSRKGLSHALMRYKQYVLGDRSAVVDTVNGGSGNELDPENPASVALALRKQFFSMNERIQMETETEMALNKLFPTTVREFLASARIGKDLVAMYEKFDMLDAETETGGRSGQSFKGPVDMEKVITNPESRHKIMGIMELVTGNPEMLDDLKPSEEKKRRRPRKRRGDHNADDKGEA